MARTVQTQRASTKVNRAQMEELLHQALETETGGIAVYEAALRNVQNRKLKQEWSKYLGETQEHQRILHTVFEELGIDRDAESTGRKVVNGFGAALLEAMAEARRGGDRAAAQITAAECVVHAETKDHLNWYLIGELAKRVPGKEGKVLQAAYDKVEDEEDEHLYHTAGWTRELWLEWLGAPARLPPPEETQDVRTAAGAARAKKGRAVKVTSRGGSNGHAVARNGRKATGRKPAGRRAAPKKRARATTGRAVRRRR